MDELVGSVLETARGVSRLFGATGDAVRRATGSLLDD